MKQFSVEEGEEGQRLDLWLVVRSELSRSRVQTLIREGRVTRQDGAGLTPKTPVRVHEMFTLEEVDSVLPQRFGAEKIPLDILYEDKMLLAIAKPAGLVVHPAAGHWTGTLVNALMHHCAGKLAERGGADRLGIVHRLDKETSGVIVVAKTDAAHEALSRQFAERTTHKEYAALAWGQLRHPFGSWRGAIGRHPRHRQKMAVLTQGGREAWTDFRLKKQFSTGALVHCVIHTGRTHQIRVHLAHAGYPVIGDTLYSRARLLPDGSKCPRQMLHAHKLRITHPGTRKEIEFEAPLPEDFLRVYSMLEHHE